MLVSLRFDLRLLALYKYFIDIDIDIVSDIIQTKPVTEMSSTVINNLSLHSNP